MGNRDRTYLGEIHHDLRLIVVSDRDDFTGLIENVQRLAPRVDLAPSLPEQFDWSPVGNALRAERLAVALLADALRDHADGDELAIQLSGELVENTIRTFPGEGFRIEAWSIERWATETAVRRGLREAEGRFVEGPGGSVAPTGDVKLRRAI